MTDTLNSAKKQYLLAEIEHRRVIIEMNKRLIATAEAEIEEYRARIETQDAQWGQQP